MGDNSVAGHLEMCVQPLKPIIFPAAKALLITTEPLSNKFLLVKFWASYSPHTEKRASWVAPVTGDVH